jgi:hypothetical protein
MSALRILLLVPILYSLAVLVGVGLAISKVDVAQAQSAAPPFPLDKAWHDAAMRAEDPESLRNHAEKLWALFQHADGAAESFLSSTKQALRVAILGAVFTLAFCTAAFVKAKRPVRDRRMEGP